MTAVLALIYSFLFGLLHGILPDEHTWPITFSYAIGGASGKEGIKAGLYFSAAFTFQRALLSEAAYLALAPFLLSPAVNGIVYIVVGFVMAVAGIIVVRRNKYPHFHLLGHHHEHPEEMERTGHLFSHDHSTPKPLSSAPPVRWTIIHGFIAGFGFGGFSLYINTIAAPKMPNAWMGFLPGLLFGLGTMIVLVIIGFLFGASLRWTKTFSEEEIKHIGSQTGGRTLFFGGLLFLAFGIATLMGLAKHIPVDMGYLLIGLFMIIVAVPAFVYSVKEVLRARRHFAQDL